MTETTFKITRNDFITLQDLLKCENLVASGGEAKAAITQDMVKVNGETENRRGKKLRKGDIVVFGDTKITIDNA